MPVLPRGSSSSLNDATFDASIQLKRTLSHVANLIQHSASQFKTRIYSRQSSTTVVAIPALYQGLNSGPAPGAVAGIVLGSVAGFLLLIWLLWTLSNGTSFIRTSRLEEESVIDIRRRSRSARSRHSYARTEMSARSPPRPPRRDRVIREERIIREIPRSRDVSRIRETIIINDPPPERRVPGDDEIEVIEEHSEMSVPPPRRQSRRGSTYSTTSPKPL